MNIVQRLIREPVAITGLATAIIGVLVAFGVSLSETQVGAIMILIGAILVVLRFAIEDPTAKSFKPDVPPEHRAENGMMDNRVVLLVAVFGGILLLWILGAFGPSPLR